MITTDIMEYGSGSGCGKKIRYVHDLRRFWGLFTLFHFHFELIFLVMVVLPGWYGIPYILLRDNEAMKTERIVEKGVDLGNVWFLLHMIRVGSHASWMVLIRFS